VVSTGLGPSILGRSAYERYRTAAHGVPPDVTALPAASVLLPSGTITGGLATIPSLALVGTSSNPRGACEEVHAHHYLVTDAKDHRGNPDDNPCTANITCGAPAMIELRPATPIDVIVVADADPTLQSLRAELRPDQAEVDGILGTAAMRAIELDVDYPNNRVVARCGAGVAAAECSTRPQLPTTSTRAAVAACIAR